MCQCKYKCTLFDTCLWSAQGRILQVCLWRLCSWSPELLGYYAGASGTYASEFLFIENWFHSCIYKDLSNLNGCYFYKYWYFFPLLCSEVLMQFDLSRINKKPDYLCSNLHVAISKTRILQYFFCFHLLLLSPLGSHLYFQGQ